MDFVVVAYYTVNTPYAEEVKNLIASLEQFNLPKDIVGVPDFGDWQANCHHVPYFLKQMLIKHYPKSIVYLDADAKVLHYPILFEKLNCDLAAHYFKDSELLAGTLYLANRPKTYEVIERWISSSFDYPTIWIQKILQMVITGSTDLNLHVEKLPPQYCKIFDLMASVPDAVIEHYQASRRFK